MMNKNHSAMVNGVTAYANAAEVLPADLVEEIQKHHTGMLYVPSTGAYYDKRKTLILALVEKGVPAKEIARMAGITPRRVRQVVQDARVAERGMSHE